MLNLEPIRVWLESGQNQLGAAITADIADLLTEVEELRHECDAWRSLSKGTLLEVQEKRLIQKLSGERDGEINAKS